MHELERFERVLEERAVVEEPLEDLPACDVVGHALERLPQRRESLRPLAELADLQRSEPVKQVRLGTGVRLDGDPPLEHVGQALRVVQTRQQSIERAEHGGIVPHPLHGRGVRLGPARSVVELLFARLAEPDEEIGRDVRVEDADRALLQRVGVAPPALHADPVRESLDLRVERGVLRLLGQSADQRRLGPLDVAERRLRHLREGAERTSAVRRLGLRPQPQLERRRELLVFARGAEHGLERVGGVGAELVVRSLRCSGSPRPTPRRSRPRAPRGTPRAPTARPGAGRRRAPRSASSTRAGRLRRPRPRPGASGCRAARATGARACRERRGAAGPRRPSRARPAPERGTRWPRAGRTGRSRSGAPRRRAAGT